MPVTWVSSAQTQFCVFGADALQDETKEKQLLLSIIHFTSPSPPWAEIAKAMGEDVTEEACKFVSPTLPPLTPSHPIHTKSLSRQKLKKLKAAAKEQYGEAPPVLNEDGTPKTPAKRGRKPAAANGDGGSKSTGKRKAKKDAAGEEGEKEGTPTKKVKSAASEDDAAAAGGEEEVKNEEAAGED